MDKVKLLIHACCGPDLTYPLEILKDNYDVHVFFYNPNIHPIREYYRRMVDAIIVTEIYDVTWVEAEYDYKRWFDMVRGYEKEPEGGKRCEICFRMRLERTCRKAEELGMYGITTTLTISPHKNSDLIKTIGEDVCRDSKVRYLHFNFKKKDGFKKSVELSRRYNLYRQKYCGCVYSLRESIEYFKRRGREVRIW